MSTSLFEHLALVDATMLASSRPPVPAQERRAIKLTHSVDPEAGRGFDWLMPEAANSAKFIHHEQSADFTLFVFDDRSVLVLLSTGYVYSVASGNPDSVQKISAWLASHNIVLRPDEAPDDASHKFEGPND